MKNILIYLTVFIVLSLSVIAGMGRVVDVDFSKEDSHTVNLFEDDRVRFYLLGAEHTIIIDRIVSNKDRVNLDIFPYLDNITYAVISPDVTLKIDLDRDGVDDLNLSMGFVNDEEILLILKKSGESEVKEITGWSTFDIGNLDLRKANIILISVAIILFLYLYKYSRKKMSKLKEF